jgi:putative PIN family toxin of toxin-antitoxin system
LRVFLDTNVLVSAFTTRGICADVLSTVLAEHQLVLGGAVLDELQRVLKTKMGMPESTTAEALALLRREGAVASSAAELALEIRDPDDAIVLGQAVQVAADVLVTGDRDLLDVAADAPIEIVSPRGFWEMLQSRQ